MEFKTYEKILTFILSLNLFLLAWNISDLLNSITTDQTTEVITYDIIFVIINAMLCCFLYYRIRTIHIHDKNFKTWRSYDK